MRCPFLVVLWALPCACGLSLAPTEVHTIHADSPVVFDFSDGGAVNIILNGHERGVPGDLGKPKQVTVP